MGRRAIHLAVELGIVRLILLEHVINGGQQHPGNGDNSFLVTSAFFERKVAFADFRELFRPNSTQSALHQQRLDIGTSPTDPGGFLLPGALVVLRRKPGPGA